MSKDQRDQQQSSDPEAPRGSQWDLQDNGSVSSSAAKAQDGAQNDKDHNPKQTRYLKPDSLVHEIALVTVICIVQIFVQAGLAQTVAILHIIGPTFQSSTAELTWYVSAYSLTIGTFILFAGRLGDIYGHKKVFIFGILWFGLWSMFAGVAAYANQIFFDCARALQGSGAAVMMPNAAALLGRTYPPGPRKAMAMSLFGACAPNGFLIGALFSGIFAQLTWWPWTFWTCGIICVFLAAACHWIIPSLDEDPTDIKLVRTKSKSFVAQKMEELDVYGAISGVSALVLINFAWNQGPVVGWDVPYTYALMIVGFLFLALFFFVELRLASNPLVPVKKIGFDSAFALGCISAGWASFGIFVYYLWQLWEVFRHLTPLESTAQLVPAGISGAIAAILTGIVVNKISPGWVMLAAMCAFAVGNILLATVPIEQTYWAQTFVATLITPWVSHCKSYLEARFANWTSRCRGWTCPFLPGSSFSVMLCRQMNKELLHL